MNKQSYNSVTAYVRLYILHTYATVYIARAYRYILHVYIAIYCMCISLYIAHTHTHTHMSLYSHSLTYVKVVFCGILHKLNFT